MSSNKNQLASNSLSVSMLFEDDDDEFNDHETEESGSVEEKRSLLMKPSDDATQVVESEDEVNDRDA